MARIMPLDMPLAEAGEWCCSTVPPAALDEPIGDGEVAVGDRVVVHSRGQLRAVRVVKVTAGRVIVAYTTPGGIDEARRHGWTACAMTEKAVKRSETWRIKGAGIAGAETLADDLTDDERRDLIAPPHLPGSYWDGLMYRSEV